LRQDDRHLQQQPGPVAMGSCFRRNDGSHRRPKHPGREFGAAEIEAFALGRLARGGLEHQVEDALAALLHGFFAGTAANSSFDHLVGAGEERG
jgi:hypothetical protein